MSAFGGPPGPGRDPDVTQPLPRVTVVPDRPVPPPTGRKGPKSPRAAAPPGTFVPRYGNGFAYLLARFVAFLVDIPGLAFLAAACAFGALHLDTRATALVGQSSYPFVAFCSLGGALVFAMLCEGLIGTTAGKALFMLHVSRARGGYAGLGRAIVRALLRPVDLLLIGPLLAAVTPRHQRLGDFAAGTTVARSPAGVLAPVLALLVLGGAGYAEVAYGGGLDSALAVAVQTSTFAPSVRDGAVGLAGGLFGLFGAPGSRGTQPLGATATATPAAGGPLLATPGPEGSAAPGGSPASAASPDAVASDAASQATFPPEDAATPAAATTPGAGATPGADATPDTDVTPGGKNELLTPAPAETAGTTPV